MIIVVGEGVTYKDRCGDCHAVVDHLGEWVCDLADRPCESIITCQEWDIDSPFATITHTLEGRSLHE